MLNIKKKEMNPFYAFFDRSYGYARSIITLIVGLLLVIWPDVAVVTMIYVIGALILAAGIVSLFLSYFGKWKEDKPSLLTMNAIVDISFGIVLIIFPKFFASIIMFLFGIILLLFGVSGVVGLFQSNKIIKISWTLFVIPVLTTLAGITIFFNPFSSAQYLTIFFGAFLLLYSIGEFISTFKVRHDLKDTNVESRSHEKENSPLIEDTPFEEVKNEPKE